MMRIVVLLALFLFLMWNVARTVQRFRLSPFGRQLAALWRMTQSGGAVGGGPPTGRPGGAVGPQAGPTASVLRRCSVCGTHVPEERLSRLPGGALVCADCGDDPAG